MADQAETSITATRARRAWLVAALVVLVLAGVLTCAYFFFVGWRARDLAAKARANFENANYRMAWMQINSAKNLKPEDPDVLRVMAMVDAAIGRATALDYYEKLSQKVDLSPEDLKARAGVAARFGSDEQFGQAVEALEKAGEISEAAKLRAARQVRQGNLDRAIAEARIAADISGDPAEKLQLARLIVQRYQPEFGEGIIPSAEAVVTIDESVGIIDSLLATPVRDEALAFGLSEANASPELRLKWAKTAMEKPDAQSPALLPAVTVLVASGEKTAGEIHAQLRSLFDATPLESRAAYAQFLTGAGMPKEALALVTAQEAFESNNSFVARTGALSALKNYDAVLAAVQTGGNVDADLLLLVKARAEYARGRDAQTGPSALREAMDAAANLRRIERIISAADSLGASALADEKLVELCGDPGLTDYVFPIARDRLARRGKFLVLSNAFERARDASLQSPAVLDYWRYRSIIGGGKTDLAETAAAVASDPANVSYRVTHALNILRQGKPAEAMDAFDGVTVFANRLTPGQLAVLAAVLSANNDDERALRIVAAIDPELLEPREYALIAPLRTGVKAP